MTFFFKEKVFKYHPHFLEKLKESIREKVLAIPIQMCRQTVESFWNYLQEIIAANNLHFKDVL